MRSDDCPYFLVPVKPNAETISLPGYLNSFNMTLLKAAKVKPLTNHWRKKFHTELQNLTKDKEKLQDLMTILDANGRKIQSKHYIMKDPDEDCVLAKALVKHVLGATVPWPTQAEAAAECAVEANAAMIDEVAQSAAEMEDHMEQLRLQPITDEDDPDDEPDQEWACGEIFGVMPVGQLNLMPLGDKDADALATPIADAPQALHVCSRVALLVYACMHMHACVCIHMHACVCHLLQVPLRWPNLDQNQFRPKPAQTQASPRRDQHKPCAWTCTSPL